MFYVDLLTTRVSSIFPPALQPPHVYQVGKLFGKPQVNLGKTLGFFSTVVI